MKAISGGSIDVNSQRLNIIMTERGRAREKEREKGISIDAHGLVGPQRQLQMQEIHEEVERLLLGLLSGR